MEHYSKFLKGIALSALASVILGGTALAVPTPTYPRFDPGSDGTVAAPAVTASAPGARILSRTSNGSLARGTLQSGGANNVASISTVKRSRSKARYYMPGMVLAALTPLALHRSGEPGDQSVAVQTRTPESSASLPSLKDALLGGGGGGHGHGRGNGGNGGGGDDGEDCDDNDGGGDNGDEVCDTGDHGGNGDNEDCGDCEDNGGDCDNGGDNGGGGGGGGGDHGGGGTSLPEPGTVPLLGAGLMMVLAFRSRRNR
jgi:hypothetical protein